jgi:hypothetical protein
MEAVTDYASEAYIFDLEHPICLLPAYICIYGNECLYSQYRYYDDDYTLSHKTIELQQYHSFIPDVKNLGN